MPRGDRTGPWSAGSMTGRAAGYCAGHSVPGYINSARESSRGFGRGWGRGHGRGWRKSVGRSWYSHPLMATPPLNPQAYAPITQPQLPEQEAAALENYQKNLAVEKADLEQEIEGVKARIEELKTKQTSE